MNFKTVCYDTTLWKLVPVIATTSQVAAGISTTLVDTGDDAVDEPNDYRAVYQSMINASPEWTPE